VDIPSVLYDTENNMNQTQTLLTRASADEGHIKKKKRKKIAQQNIYLKRSRSVSASQACRECVFTLVITLLLSTVLVVPK